MAQYAKARRDLDHGVSIQATYNLDTETWNVEIRGGNVDPATERVVARNYEHYLERATRQMQDSWNGKAPPSAGYPGLALFSAVCALTKFTITDTPSTRDTSGAAQPLEY
jgi:hypothetical protein